MPERLSWPGKGGKRGVRRQTGNERVMTMYGTNLHDSDDGRGLLIPIPIVDENQAQGLRYGGMVRW